jgi:hypothetical protein
MLRVFKRFWAVGSRQGFQGVSFCPRLAPKALELGITTLGEGQRRIVWDSASGVGFKLESRVLRNLQCIICIIKEENPILWLSRL